MQFLLLIPIYFLCQQYIPWPGYEILNVIPVYLIFDLLFAAGIIWMRKEKCYHLKFNRKQFFVSSIQTITIALFSLLLLSYLKFLTPFKFLPNYAFKIVILAPVFEEVLFRGAFHSILRPTVGSKLTILFSAMLFSLSHFLVYFAIADHFKAFILFQVGYTFVLGFIIAKQYEEDRSLFASVVLHFFFNFLFFLALEAKMIA